MKQLRVNSDKYSTMGVAMMLVFALFDLVMRARDLYFLTYHPLPRTWINYLMGIFFAYIVLGSSGDRKLLLKYPFGAAGCGLWVANFVLNLALPRGASGSMVMIPAFAGLAGSLLIILEIARWFRATVTLV